MSGDIVPTDDSKVERIRNDLDALNEPKSQRRFKKLFLAALGAVPWIGGFFSAIGSIRNEEKQGEANQLQREWLEEHGHKFIALGTTLNAVTSRLEDFGDEVQAVAVINANDGALRYVIGTENAYFRGWRPGFR